MKPRILLITNSYPSLGSKEKNFVHEEVESYIDSGFSVFVMPFYYSGEIDSDFRGVLVSELASENTLFNLSCSSFGLLFKKYFWVELFFSFNLFLGSFRRFKNFLRSSVKCEVVRKVLLRLGGDKFDVLYTYWCSGECVAVSELKQSRKNDMIAITRMHGFDIYEERDYNNGYIPYRKVVLPVLDKLIVLSAQAKEYIVSKYPDVEKKIVISPLGVQSRESLVNINWEHDSLTFFSCSYPAPVKRLDKIFQLVYTFSLHNPKMKIIWNHFGCSLSESNVVICDFPDNLQVAFQGKTDREVFMTAYCNAVTPVFINMSDSEGQPVSIMEAMSCGLPIIATNVGGVSEVVGYDSGVLIEYNEDILQIVSKIKELTQDFNVYNRMSAESRQRQTKYYDQYKNHCELSEKLRKWCE